MRYMVIGHVAASVSEVVEADFPEDAIDRADLGVSLCHHCARKLTVGDIYAHTVIEDEGSGETVLDDSDQRGVGMASPPKGLDAIVARHDRLGSAAKSRGVTQAVRDRAELIDWLRRSGVLPKEGA